MKCPHCGEELQLPNNTLTYMENYVLSCRSITLCCNKMVDLYPKITFSAYKNDTDDEDEWGRRITK